MFDKHIENEPRRTIYIAIPEGLIHERLPQHVAELNHLILQYQAYLEVKIEDPHYELELRDKMIAEMKPLWQQFTQAFRKRLIPETVQEARRAFYQAESLLQISLVDLFPNP